MTLLHYAAYGRSADLVDFLIDKGAKPDAADPEGDTPLHIAAMSDRTEVVAALLGRGAPIEARNEYGRTPLLLCARERGQTATARVLIEAGADVNASDKFGSTALELAAWRGKAELIDLLLEKGAKVPESGEKWQAGLSEAAAQGLTKLFRRLIEAGQDLKALGPSGETLLHAAAGGGSAEIVGLLIDRGFHAGRVRSLRLDASPLRRPRRPGRGRPDADRARRPPGRPHGHGPDGIQCRPRKEDGRRRGPADGKGRRPVGHPLPRPQRGLPRTEAPRGHARAVRAGHRLLDLGSPQHGRLLARRRTRSIGRR